jgi:tRNA threonylcarbamoyladenosine biosynthesis protein TsaB
MKLLAVETATEACSAALYLDGEVLERIQLTQREHSKLILPMLDELLAEAALSLQDLDALAFGRGPGSFTGVRIATGVIHGLAFGADLPVVPVSTLAAIAQCCFDHTLAKIAYAAMDARMGEIYWGVYRRNAEGFAELMEEESVGLAEQVQFPKLEGYGVGSGWKVYEQALRERLQGLVGEIDADCLPRAAAIVRLGAAGLANNLAVPVEQAMPVYLRDKVAKKESER